MRCLVMFITAVCLIFLLKFSSLAAKAGNVTSMDFALENQNSQRRDELLELSVHKG